MKGNTIELYKNGRLYQTFFNSLVNTDNLNEGILQFMLVTMNRNTFIQRMNGVIKYIERNN